jgi:hypothetical protein
VELFDDSDQEQLPQELLLPEDRKKLKTQTTKKPKKTKEPSQLTALQVLRKEGTKQVLDSGATEVLDMKLITSSPAKKGSKVTETIIWVKSMKYGKEHEEFFGVVIDWTDYLPLAPRNPEDRL